MGPEMRDALTVEDLRFTPPNLPAERLLAFLKEHWGIQGESKRLEGERDQNFRIRSNEGVLYVYKIGSPIEPPELVDFQIQALLHLEQADPELPIPHIVRTLSGEVARTLTDEAGQKHVVRVLSYVPGIPMRELGPIPVDTASQIGALQGRLCRAFVGFEHEAAAHFMPWDILNGLVVTESLCTNYLDAGLAVRCAPMLAHLKNVALPRMRRLPHQVIHNDAHAGNIMVDPEGSARVTGVIDFGDLVRRPIIVDLATSLASLVERTRAPMEMVTALVSSFQRQVPIPRPQLELLYDAVAARAILTVQLLQFRVNHTPADDEIREVELPNSKEGLDRILRIDRAEFLCVMRELGRLPGGAE